MVENVYMNVHIFVVKSHTSMSDINYLYMAIKKKSKILLMT